MPPVPSACDLRLSISWLTTSDVHMNNSHVATKNFYHNLTQCVIVESIKIERTIDFTELVAFSFDYWRPTKDNKKNNPEETKKRNLHKLRRGNRFN